MINRIGDALLIMAIVLLWFLDPFSSNFIPHVLYEFTFLSFLLLVGLITKSAIFPFSPWLPIAMRAPTPISALVHSSTLVTAGLYLIISLNRLIFTLPRIRGLFLALSVFTSLYAGLGTLVESDLKKLVALSTLSHLGFIGLAISLGHIDLALFHLLTHALFKSLLFIGVGDYISVGQHYQDARQLSGGICLSPLSRLVILSSVLRLLGFPFIAGFYSKDYVLEFSTYSSISVLVIGVIYLNVLLTFIYTLRIFYYTICPNLFASPYFLVSNYLRVHFTGLGALALSSLAFPLLYFHIVPSVVLATPLGLHYLPLILLGLLSFVTIVIVSYPRLHAFSLSVEQIVLITIFSTMSYLYTLYRNYLGTLVVSKFYLLGKTCESGLIRSL